MLKKEWRDIFLPMLLRLHVGPILALMQAVIAGRINEETALVLFFGFAISLLWVALHMGLNVFQSEFRYHAFEYWLTFPQRLGLKLIRKFVLRLLVLACLLGAYCLFLNYLKNVLQLPQNLVNAPFLGSGNFSLLALIYFIIGFFLSLVDWGSVRPLVPLLILGIYLSLAFRLERSFGYSGSVVSGIFLILVSGMWFLFNIRKLRRGILDNSLGKSCRVPTLVITHSKNGRKWGLLRHELRIVARSFIWMALFIPVLGYLVTKVNFNSGGPGQMEPFASYACSAFFILVLFAFDSGYKLFHSELRQKALEYLLTFPMNIRRVLAEKLLARILVLLPILIAFMIFSGHFSDRLSQDLEFFHVFLRPALLPFWIILMLLNGFSLSLFEMKNMIALVSVADMYMIVLVPLAVFALLKRFSIETQNVTVLVYGSGLLLAILILGGIFFRVRRRFDLAAPQRYSKAYGLFIFFVFNVVSLASLAIVIFL